jgi:hypothetical protein
MDAFGAVESFINNWAFYNIIMFEQVRTRMPSIDERSMWRLSFAILLVLLAMNLLLCVLAWGDASRLMGAMLYGLNALTIALMCCTLLYPPMFIQKETLLGLLALVLVAMIAMMFTCTAFISCVFTFGQNYTPDDPVVFVSSIIAIAAYVAYIAKLYSEKNFMWG